MGGFLAFGSIFCSVLAFRPSFGIDLVFWSSFRFFGVFLALESIFHTVLAFYSIFGYWVDFW